MSEFDDIINDFKATAYKPTTEEVLESEIKRVDGKVDTIEKELTEKIDETLAIVEEVKKKEGPAGYTPKKGVDYEDGKDYVLTPEDKEEIAKTIVVPIVEKVIIRETPIVTENKFETIKEVALHETGEQTVEKINSLPLEDEYKIDASHIKNLPKSDSQVGGGLSRGVADRLYAPIGSSGGATAWGDITGNISNQTDLQTALNANESLAIAYAVAL